MRRIQCIIPAGLSLLAACSSQEILVAHSVPLASAVETIPEAQLLDVGIVVFEPGVPEGEVDKEVLEQLIREGTFVQIRRTEAWYFADQLKESMQASGHWGAVWVTPEPSAAADLNVTAEILHSDGSIVRVRARAVDATGQKWLDQDYELETAAGAYNRQRYPDLDPYEDLFNLIANDLAAIQDRLSANQARRIRTVGELRYAGDLSPEAFGGYIEEGRGGTYEPVRLPAAGDPIFDRTRRIRQRERLFLETLNQHYDNFAIEVLPSYDGWREYAREEAIAIREATRSARFRTGVGIATILASVVYGSQSGNNEFQDRVVRDALMYVGMDMLRTSALRRQEKRLHVETLEELSLSFDESVEPLIVEIEGTEHRLTGTVEVQYEEWQQLLRELFISETGFVPENVNVFIEEAAAEELLPEQPDTATTDETRKTISDAGGGVAGGV